MFSDRFALTGLAVLGLALAGTTIASAQYPPAAAPAAPRSAYAVQPPTQSLVGQAAQAPANLSQPSNPYPSSAASGNPQQGYPQGPQQGYPQGPMGNAQPQAPQGYPPAGNFSQGNLRPSRPDAGQIRLAQQPSAAGQTASAGSSDLSGNPMNGVAAAVGADQTTPSALPVELTPHAGAATEHPLAPAIRWAASELENIRQIQDYSCFFYKRERIDGQLGGYQAMYCKVRHEPFSVYMYFKAPSNLEGQEVIYVKGLNDGNLQAHTTGIKSVVGTVSLSPTGSMAMRGNRYPITETGILNLLERLVAVGNKDMQYGECDVQFFTSAQGVKVGGRPCTCIQVTHPVPRRNFIFHQARIYVDEEMRLPIRYESYDWPTQPGGQPLLMEEYTYQNLKVNNGFADVDFDTRNPNYGFR